MNDIQHRLHERTCAKPFVPFRITMSSGGSYDVTSPYMIATGKSLIAYIFPKSNRMASLPQEALSSIKTIEVPDERKKR